MDAGLENAKVFWVLAEDLFVEKLPAGDMTYLVDDRSFKARIKQALEYLGDSSPEWLQYVTQREYWIGPCGPCPDGRSKASWSLDLSDRRVYIHEDTFESNMRLAQVLVHESCHIHQGYEDRWPPGVLDADTIVRLEKECNAKELEMTLDIDPDDPSSQNTGGQVDEAAPMVAGVCYGRRPLARWV